MSLSALNAFNNINYEEKKKITKKKKKKFLMANVTLFNLIIYSTDHSQMSSLASLSIEILVMLTSKFKHTL